MTTTLHEFSRHRRTAASRREILVQDSRGTTAGLKRVDEPVRTMADLVGHLAGRVQTGKRVKSLAGYGRLTVPRSRPSLPRGPGRCGS